MTKPLATPLIPASSRLPEFTVKAIVLAVILAVVLAAANTYLALKIGNTISASIPAAVFALGVLRCFKRSNVLECNLVQTAASAGEGVAAATAFILPAMILLHVWQRFPFWETMLATLFGSVLGVMFSVPLRRIMLSLPQLRFPEGTAIAQVLIASTQQGAFFRQLVRGGILGGVLSFAQTGWQVIAESAQAWWFAGRAVLGMTVGFTPATLAAGFIVGPQVAITLLVGLVLGWVVVLPTLVAHFGADPNLTAYQNAMLYWSTRLRFVGVGAMLVGGVWTLLRLLKPVCRGLSQSWSQVGRVGPGAALRVPRTEQDLSARTLVITIGLVSVLWAVFFWWVAQHYALLPRSGGHPWLATGVSLLYVLGVGFMLATICAYFTGLVGVTNNPLSGMLIIALLLLASLYLLIYQVDASNHLAALVVLVVTSMACVASISNENLQDLKAGQLLGATPWRQQVLLLIGAGVSSLVMAPLLNLLLQAYGIAGITPHAGMDPAKTLAAPQASLMAAVVQGVLWHRLDTAMISIGALLAVGIVVIDELLRRRGLSLPCLAVGLAIYLPPDITTPIIIGGLLAGWVAHKKPRGSEDCHQAGVLLACGLVAGSSLMGVILAVPFVLLGSATALAIVSPAFLPWSVLLGIGAMVLLCVSLYRAATR